MVPHRAVENVVHAKPARQPTGVHQLTPKLFGAYTVTGGSIRLAGCTLEDRPVVRMKLRRGGSDEFDMYVHGDGESLDHELVEQLGLDDVEPFTDEPPSWASDQANCLLDGDCVAALVPQPHAILGRVIIWCKYAQGKVSFLFGDRSLDIRFAGWASSLASGRLPPPPLVCPASGRESYAVACTDDGLIAAREMMTTSASSGARVLSANAILRHVGHSGLIKSVSKDDPRLARILAGHAGLARRRHWKMYETGSLVGVTSGGLMRKLFAIFDRQTLQPRHVATAPHPLASWVEVPEPRYAEFLGQ